MFVVVKLETPRRSARRQFLQLAPIRSLTFSIITTTEDLDDRRLENPRRRRGSWSWRFQSLTHRLSCFSRGAASVSLFFSSSSSSFFLLFSFVFFELASHKGGPPCIVNSIATRSTPGYGLRQFLTCIGTAKRRDLLYGRECRYFACILWASFV